MSNSSSSSVSSSSSRGGLWDDAAGHQPQQHRRGQSFLSAKDKDRTKDEDLALFQDMRMREDSAFLHPSMVEMDQGSLTAKFGGLSGYRVSARKGSTDLLTSETDKNDYDWLLTPPGTPLFPSLDRDLLVASPAQRDSSRWTSKLSRLSSDAQAQAEQAPALIHSSASSSSRPAPRGSNPSPRRQSAPSTTTPKSKPLSPAAANAGLVRPSTPTTLRGRPSSSSAPSSSARPSTPTGRTRPSTPTRSSTAAAIRPSTPTPRSSGSSAVIRPSTPTPTTAAASRRPSTSNGRPGAAASSSSSSRGTSPLRKPAGRSPQASFACEPQPPNLRTSAAAERPSSNSRGATIPSSSRPANAAAGNGVDVALLRRQAALPILTRSYNAPHHHHHHDREMSSFSRRAITSANEGARAPLEDDKSTTAAYVKKQQQQPLRSCGSRETSFFGTSISKKSLDTAIRHMDIRRSSPGGFRPLMPSATPLSSSSYSRAGTTVARHQPNNRLGNSAQIGCEERSQAAAEDSQCGHNLLVSDVKARQGGGGEFVEECGHANSDLFTANGDDLLLELTGSSLDDLSGYSRITDAGQELRILEEDYLTL